MYRYIYTSRSVFPMGDISDLDILREADTRNRSEHITGGLLRDPTSFLQVLEGERIRLMRLTKDIIKDPRHYTFRILQRGTVAQRLFPGWSMGYVAVGATTMTAFHDLCQTSGPMMEEALKALKPSLTTAQDRRP
jgi:hypothetical protein